MKPLWTSLFVAVVLVRPCFASGPAMERRPWPAAAPCSSCVVLQFGMMEMRLPAEQVGKIFVSSSAPFALHLLPPGAADGRQDALFMSAPEDTYIGKYRALGLPSPMTAGAEAFFDALGHPVPESDPVSKVRRIEGIGRAARYAKMSRGALHAYWIQSAAPDTQYVHLIVGETVYSLVGQVSPALVDAVLGNLRIAAEP